MIPDNEPIWQHGRRAGRREALAALRPTLLVGEAAMLSWRLWDCFTTARYGSSRQVRSLMLWRRAGARYERRVAAASRVGGEVGRER